MNRRNEQNELTHCKTCRFSIGYYVGKPLAVLWCELREIEARRQCNLWERAPGTEGDDD